ncbi:MAG: tRNA (adenosine(37)-N6)-threonylcarbamoyltransferase complex ATPase subunit type 1 TsaE [Chlamydiae bacterium]|nr:tRNA (adenosine(37)-N6)-threonylcarbamoyltransferase complex ATPase subunit type 1 TsaE [Chlamydiota bacterium]
MQGSPSSSYSSFSAEETIIIASQLAKSLIKGDIVTLHGPLGAGKTTFVKGIISALCNISLHEVSSPTFTYMNIYTGENPVHHFDLYRITNEEQFFQLGLCEYLDQNAICLVEWPEKISSYLKNPSLRITLSYRDANERLIEITREKK